MRTLIKLFCTRNFEVEVTAQLTRSRLYIELDTTITCGCIEVAREVATVNAMAVDEIPPDAIRRSIRDAVWQARTYLGGLPRVRR